MSKDRVKRQKKKIIGNIIRSKGESELEFSIMEYKIMKSKMFYKMSTTLGNTPCI
jgi:hypothetical protein